MPRNSQVGAGKGKVCSIASPAIIIVSLANIQRHYNIIIIIICNISVACPCACDNCFCESNCQLVRTYLRLVRMAESSEELSDHDTDWASTEPAAKKKKFTGSLYVKPSFQRNGRKHGHLCQLYLVVPQF